MISLDDFKHNRARVILFFTSFSVILITLGIIHTLLIESITFFSEIADSRGWFTFEWDFKGFFSSYGVASLLFLCCVILEIFSSKLKELKQSSIDILLFPRKLVVNLILLVLIVQLLFIDNRMLGLAFLFIFIGWRRLASNVKKIRYGMQTSDDITWRNIVIAISVLTLLKSITMNYGGAFGEFFLQTQWTPTGACSDRRSLCETMSFGVNSLLLTTLQVAFGALIIAVPLGVGCAIYLSEYAPPRLVAVVKPTLELLAGIPSVVYGFFAFIYIGPLVMELGEYFYQNGWIDQPPNVLNPINGAIVVGVMILPLVASMSEDALRAVPNELREGSLALGATKIETTFKVMIQASLSGIIASIILALSRAVGETMAVTLAVGTVAVYTANMFVPAQTMTAYIAQRVGGDLPFGEIGYLTIFAVGLYLFIITLTLNLIGNKILSTYREAY